MLFKNVAKIFRWGRRMYRPLLQMRHNVLTLMPSASASWYLRKPNSWQATTTSVGNRRFVSV